MEAAVLHRPPGNSQSEPDNGPTSSEESSHLTDHLLLYWGLLALDPLHKKRTSVSFYFGLKPLKASTELDTEAAFCCTAMKRDAVVKESVGV